MLVNLVSRRERGRRSPFDRSVLCEQTERVRLWGFYLRFCSLKRLCYNGHTGSWGFGPAERWNPIPRPKNLIWVMSITRQCISAAGRAAVFMRNPRRSRAYEHVVEMHGFYVDFAEKVMRFDLVIDFEVRGRVA